MAQHLIVYILFLCFSLCAAEYSPLIEIYQGKLRGVVKNDWKGGKFYSFLSIPYAKKPIGKLRFMIPASPEKWEGIFDATEDMPPCMQRDWFGNTVGQEDCLYLNLHTPEISTKNLKPVMVFIHGGGYLEGNGRYDMVGPEFLIPEGVLLVTIHYRLGLLGFLYFENPNVGVFGNMGLKDQTMALRWVQKNIEKFGGDPKKVTIFGESAGGASVHMHMLSPMSQGLFHRVISQSGSALNAWNINTQRNMGEYTAKILGFDGKPSIDMLPFLQSLTAEEIVKVQENISAIIPIHEPVLVGPIIERNSEDLSFLPDTIDALISSKKFQEVPFMLGFTDMEAILLDVISLLKSGKSETLLVEQTVLHTFNINDEETRQEVVDKIREFYYKSADDSDRTDVLNNAGDAWVNWGIYRSALAHAKISHKDLYMYVFSADTELNYFKRLHPTSARYPGTSHVDDLGYLFKTKYTPDIRPGSVEAESMERVVKLWTNFAKYGNPTPKPDEFNVIWKPVKGNQVIALNIGTKDLTLVVNPLAERMAFWDKLHEQYGNAKAKIRTEL